MGFQETRPTQNAETLVCSFKKKHFFQFAPVKSLSRQT